MDLCSSYSGQLDDNSNKDHDAAFQYLENDLVCYTVDTFAGNALLPLFTTDSFDIST